MIMADFFKRSKSTVIIMALITLILGLILLIWPRAAALTICIILGWAMIAAGVVGVIMYFINRKNGQGGAIMLILGAISLIWGILIVCKPAFWVAFLFIIFGILLIFHGCCNFGDGIEMKRTGFSKWWVAIILGVITVVLGILAIIMPFAAATAVTIYCGIALIFDAIKDLIIVARFSKAFGKPVNP